MQVAFFSNCDCDSVTVATRFLPFYPFTFPWQPFPVP